MARRPSGYYGMSFGERGRDSGPSIAPRDFSSRAQQAAGINSDDTPPPPAPAAPSPEALEVRQNVGEIKTRSDTAKASLSGVPSVLSSLMLGIGEGVRAKMIKQIEAGGKVIRDKDGNIAGVLHDGLMKGTKGYTGRRIAGYTGEYAALIATPEESDDEPAGRLAGRGTDPITDTAPDPDSPDVNTDLPDLPDAPSGPGTGDASNAAKKKSKMGRESTIATGPSGLLTPARTRRRSLMAGLIQ